MRGQVMRPEGAYRLRQGGTTVHVRHRTRDVAILAEIFTVGTYEPPSEAPLQGPIRVHDLGGNVGLFGAYALARWDVSDLCSYEPDPSNFALLRATASAHVDWLVTPCAVGAQEGTMRFIDGQHSESREADTGELGIEVRVVDVYSEPRADLVKMDIEGGEWAILKDPRLSTLCRVIVLEWHTRGCPIADARRHASELLRAAGYVHQRHEAGRFNSNGMMWAWKG